MQTDHSLSARRADRALSLSRSARHYRPRRRDDTALIDAMQGHIKDNPGHDFGLLCDQALRARGWGKTRAWRVYVGLRLMRNSLSRDIAGRCSRTAAHAMRLELHIIDSTSPADSPLHLRCSHG